MTIELFSKDDEYETLSINASLITLNIEQDGQMIVSCYALLKNLLCPSYINK